MNGLFIAEYLDQNYNGLLWGSGHMLSLGKYLYIQVLSTIPVIFCPFFLKLLLYPFFKYKLGQTRGSKYSFLNLRFDDLRGKGSFIIFPF